MQMHECADALVVENKNIMNNARSRQESISIWK